MVGTGTQPSGSRVGLRRAIIRALLGCLASAGFSTTVAAQPLVVSNYTLVRERAVSRTVSEYEYRAVLTNSGSTPLAKVTGSLVALLPTTKVTDGSLTFDNVPAGGSQVSTDTFVVRRPRILPLTPGEFVWTLSVNGLFEIGGYVLVRERRVSAILSDFDYRATLNNRGSSPISGANATVVSALSTTKVVDVALTFGSIGVGQNRASEDTLTLRRLRSLPLVPEILGWTILPTSTPANQAPVARIAPLQNPPVPGTPIVLNGSASSDPDGTPITSYLWELLARPAGSNATLNATTAVASFTPDVAGSYTTRLTVSDGALSGSATQTFSTANRAPTASIGPLGAIFVAQGVRLDGSGSTDPDGDALTFAWSVASAPQGSVAAPQNATSAVAMFTPDRAGTYGLQLVVSDGPASDSESVVFITSNSAPVANAGSPQTATVGTTITLDGSRSTDIDGDPLDYLWSVAGRPAASQSSLSELSAVMPTFFIDAPGNYLFQLHVTDPSGASSQPATVVVSTINSPPLADAGPNQSVASGALVQLTGAGSTDADGDTLSYLWEFVQVPAGSSPALNDATTVTPTFVADRRGTFVVRLTVFDPSGARSSDTVDVTTGNTLPDADAGPDQSVALGSLVRLDGSASTDIDGDTVGYAWSFTSRPENSAAALASSDSARPTFTADVPGLYTLQLLVSDGQGGTDVDTVVVSTLNSRPTAAAGPDQSVIAGQLVALDGSGSSDPDGDALTYQWALITRPDGSAAALADAGLPQASFVADQPGTYIVQLIVSDGVLTSEPDTVAITTGNTAPVADAGADPARLALGARVNLDGRSSRDADGHQLQYSWAILSRPLGSMVELSGAQGETPSFTPDTGGDYVVQLIVNDGFVNSAPDTVFIRVNRRAVANAGGARTVGLGSLVTLNGNGSSDPDLDSLSFVWTLSAPPGSGAILFDALTATPSFVPDVPGTYLARLVVNDGLNDSTPDEAALTAETTAALGLTPAAQTVPTFSTVPLTVNTTEAAGAGGLVVTLTSSDTSIATTPQTVTIPAGEVTATFDAKTGATAGTATINASAASVSSASAAITVGLRSLTLSLDAGPVGVNRTIGGRVTLAQPAPATGATIDVVPDAPVVVSVSPAAVVIAPGGTTGTFSVFGLGIGTANLFATAAGFTSASAPVTSTMTLSLGPTPFEVERAETKTATLTLSAPAPQGGLNVTLTSDNPGRATLPTSVFVPFGQSTADVLVTGVAEGTTTLRATAPGVQPAALAVTVTPPSLAKIESSPANGEGSVAVTRETILRFSRAISNTDLITPQTLFAQFGGQALPSRIHVAPDRTTVTLFYLQTLPASARVRVQFVTDGLIDALGIPLDGDGDGQPGGTTRIDFDTLTLTTLPGTAVTGRVFASQLGDGGVNTPLAGVVISVDGLETTLRTTTDAMGNFRLEPAPVGEFFVHIDGRAANNDVPVGAYYPVVGKKWESTAGQTTTIPDVFLPLIVPGTLQPVNQTQDTVITFPADVLAQDPRLAGVQLTVPADSLYSDNGARGGMVGIAPVAPDRIPSPLPPELNFPLVITVQTDGATNFDRPVPVCFPNLPDRTTGLRLRVGAKSALWSFNHDTGEWEVVGPMTVSPDASLVCTDLGVGIRQPGWHGVLAAVQTFINVLLGGPTTDTSGPACTTEQWVDAVIACTGPALLVGGGSSRRLGVKAVWVDREKIGSDLVELLTYARAVARQLKNPGASNVEYSTLFDLIGKLLKETAMRVGRNQSGQLSFIGWGQHARAAFNWSLLADRAGSLFKVLAVVLDFRDCFLDGGECVRSFLASLPEETREALTGATDRVLNSVTPVLSTKLFAALGETSLQVFLAGDAEGNIRAFNLDGSPHREAATGEPFVRPLSGLLDDRLLADADFRRGVATGILDALGFEDGEIDVLPYLNGIDVVADRAARLREVRESTDETIPLSAFSYRVVLEGETILRGSTSSSGLASLSLPPDRLVLIEVADSATMAYGVSMVASGPSGRRDYAPAVIAFAGGRPAGERSADPDGDGLISAIEDVIGTNPTTADSDGDGLSDGAEFRQGTNPLDGLAVQTGLRATADTPGVAVDVVSRNDTAILADSSRGISIVNVAAGQSPVIVAQVDTPGDAQRVAFESNLVAVVDGTAGLAIVDIADPPAARIVHQLSTDVLGGNTTSVTVAGGVAYVGLDTGRVVSVDLETGTLLESVTVTPTGAVADVAIERDTLYALTPGRLHAIPLQSPLGVSGSAASPETGAPRRLFAGGGVAYSTHFRGYNTFSLAAPGQPVLIAAGETPQFGWKQIVPNGSGLGFAAVSPNASDDGPHNVSLYDVSDPTQTDRFLTEFETPGLARAVAIYNGVGYVADSEAGLQVLNYLAFDRAGIAPTISLESNFVLTETTGSAEEGQVMRLTANVDDDVQVRNVEFFVNGASVARDGNFPFEHRFVTPLLGVTPAFTVRVCAFDTGGNQACTPDITVTLAADATPPRVTSTSPVNNARLLPNAVSSVSATFAEPIAPASLTGSFLLFAANDVPVSGGTVTYNALSNTAVLAFSTPLPVGTYRAIVRAGVTDLAGNSTSADHTWLFSVRGPVQWAVDSHGFWDEPSNWAGGEVPQAGDHVIIDRPGGPFTVTFRGDDLSIATLRSEERLRITGGVLSIESSAALNGGLAMAGNGTLAGPADITAGSLELTQGFIRGPGASLSVTGASTLSGGSITNRALRLGTTTHMTGSLGLAGTASIDNPLGGLWTSAGDVTLFGSRGTINAGTLRIVAGTLALRNGPFTNSGAVELQGGNLEIWFGGSTTGTIVGASGTTLTWTASTPNPPYVLSAGSQVNTTGTVFFDIGAVSIDGSFRAHEVQVGQGEATFTGPTPSIDSLAFVGGAGAGIVTFDTPGPVNLPVLALNAGTIAGAAALNVGAFSWGGGRFDAGGEVQVSGTTTMVAGAILGRRLTFGPSTTWAGTGRSVNVGAGAAVVNPPGSVLRAQIPGQLSFAGPGAFINNGALVKTGTGIARFNRFDNLGSVDVQEGRFWIGSGTATGPFTGLAGTEIFWQLGTYTLDASASLNTAGDVRVEQANLQAHGTFSAATLLVEGGQVTFDGPTATLGSVTALGTIGFSTTAPANLGTLVLSGSVEGAGVVNVGTFDWQSGGYSGPGELRVAGSTTIAGGLSVGGGTVRLGTFTTWLNGASFSMGSDGTVINPPGSALDVQGAGRVTFAPSSTGRFSNAGTLRKSGGGSLEFVNGPFENFGLVDLTAGVLAIGKGSSTGRFTTAEGSTLRLANHTLSAISEVSAAGRVEFAGGTTVEGSFSAGSVAFGGGTTRFTGSVGSLGASLEINGATVDFSTPSPVALPALTLTFGRLTGTSALTAPSLLWRDGSIDGTGAFTVTGVTTIDVDGPFGKSLEGRHMTLGSSTIWRGTRVGLGNGATLENPAQGSLRFENNAAISHGLGAPASFANLGTLSFGGTARRLVVENAAFSTSGTLIHRLGGLTAGSQFDQIVVNGSALLGGTLDVRTMAGFVPATGDAFDLLTFGSRTGVFGTVVGNGETYEVSYATSAVRLTKQ